MKRPTERYSLLVVNGYRVDTLRSSGGRQPPGVTAHVYDWPGDRIVATYRSEDRAGPGFGRGATLHNEGAIARAQAKCDELNGKSTAR